VINFSTNNLVLIFFSIILLISCSDDNDYANDILEEYYDSITEDNYINNFIWKGMNSWYNWQEDVNNLSDNKLSNPSQFNSYLSGFSSTEELFESLIYQKDNIDKFSWFVEDYIALQQQFQGISTSFGIRFEVLQINEDGDIIIYFEYISQDSPASRAGFMRGDIINGLNGTILNVNNYQNTISSLYDDTVTFNFVENDGITPKENKTISKAVIADNPVYLTKTFENIGGNKVGYLVYNGFRSSYNDELNTAFAELASANIQELILDLRLNGGGSVETCTYLASMIYNLASEEDVFSKSIFNNKHSTYDNINTFKESMYIYDTNGNEIGSQDINKISGLSRVYVLTSEDTASASEMIINGLKPYMNVITVGTTTYGKNVGSITLYDSPLNDFLQDETVNQDHFYAIQPIVFQIYNKNNQSDYAQGFEPNILVEESHYWNNILPFGDENEVVLKAALDDIRGAYTKANYKTTSYSKKVDLEFSFNKFDKEMYISKEFFERK